MTLRGLLSTPFCCTPFCHGKVFFYLLCPFCMGYKSVWKMNTGKLKTQHSIFTELSSCYYPMSLHFFLSLFLLPNISNAHSPTLEHMNLPWLGSQQKSPQKGGLWQSILSIRKVFSSSIWEQMKRLTVTHFSERV